MPAPPPPVQKRFMTKAIDDRSIQVREFHLSGYNTWTVYEYVQVNDPGKKPRLCEEGEVGVYSPEEVAKVYARFQAEGFTEVPST